jgi:hypothetical protein
LPPWLRDRALARELGITALLPEMRLNAAVLAAQHRQRQEERQRQAGAAGEGKKGR